LAALVTFFSVFLTAFFCFLAVRLAFTLALTFLTRDLMVFLGLAGAAFVTGASAAGAGAGGRGALHRCDSATWQCLLKDRDVKRSCATRMNLPNRNLL
jgi:hypothetical protein